MRARSLGKMFVVALALAPFAAVTAFAAEGDVTIPGQVTVAGRSLTLNGTGVRKATALKVEVYVAGLYLESRSPDPQAILRSPEPKLLLLHFVRNVGRSDMVKAFHEGFEKSAGTELPALQHRLGQLDAMLTDLKKGQELSFAFVPEGGVTVMIDGTIRGTIPGDDFERALLAIWLGPAPPNESLKEGLLGRK